MGNVIVVADTCHSENLMNLPYQFSLQSADVKKPIDELKVACSEADGQHWVKAKTFIGDSQKVTKSDDKPLVICLSACKKEQTGISHKRYKGGLRFKDEIVDDAYYGDLIREL